MLRLLLLAQISLAFLLGVATPAQAEDGHDLWLRYRPLAASSVRQCHAVLSSAYAAAVRWGWIAFNPMESAQKPRPPAPNPDPPCGCPKPRALLLTCRFAPAGAAA